MNKLDRDSCIDDFITCLPHEKPRDIAFIPSVHAWKDDGYSVNDAYHVTQHQQRKQTTNNKLYLQVQSQATHPQNARSIKKKNKAMGKIEKISHPNA